jgi:hypothetical protein
MADTLPTRTEKIKTPVRFLAQYQEAHGFFLINIYLQTDEGSEGVTFA